MSSILLSNPFVTPAPSPNVPQDTTPALAVAPTQGASAGSGADDATAFSGSGSGYSGGNAQQAADVIRNRAQSTMVRPADATSTSVVNAQTESEAEITPFGSNLPKVNMPDPLPTSPFLKRL